MVIKSSKHKSQSIVEYSLIFAAIAAAVIAMFLYMNRAVGAHLKNVRTGLNSAVGVINP